MTVGSTVLSQGWRLTGLAWVFGAWLCCLLPGEAVGAVATARAITLNQDGDTTVLSIQLDRPATFNVVTLLEPYRVVVDLAHVDFAVLNTAGGPEGGSTAMGVVTAYRFGRFAEGQSRVVIDTDGPAEVVDSTATRDSDGVMIEVRLKPSTPYAFGKVYRRRKRREAIKRQEAAAWEAIAEPAEDKAGASRKGDKKVIVIDPGHGGVDSGAVAPDRILEKHVVLAFAKQLRRALLSSGRYQVHMTRSTDVFVPLAKRVEFSRDRQADLFISVHADSVASQQYASISGTTIYTLSDQGSDEAARAFADRENRSDALAGIDGLEPSDAVASILMDLAQRETNARSERFAQVALGQIRKATKLSRGPHRSAAFAVLKAPDIPSVLIELGYLSNSNDEKLLRSAAWRARVARSISASVTRFFASQRRASPY